MHTAQNSIKQFASDYSTRPGVVTRFFDAIFAGLSAVGTVWIFVAMIMICADVLGLALFSSPIYGVVEMVENSIVPVVLLQLAHTLSRGQLTRADFLFGPLSKKDPAAAKVLDFVFLLLGAAVFAALTSGLWTDFSKALDSGEYIGTSGIFTFPTWPLQLLAVVGGVAVSLKFLLAATSSLAEALGGTLHREKRLMLPVCLAIALFFIVFGVVLQAQPDRATVGVLSILFLLVLIMGGMHVAVVLLLVGTASIFLLRHNMHVSLNALKISTTGTINKFDFAVVPLFVLMGLFTDISGIGRDAYRVAAWWTRKLLGGLAIGTVAANAIFASVTGISIASAAVFSRVAVPQMVDHGYTARFATGTVAGSSVLGMLLPPSLLLIIYGFVTETSVGQLFLAAVIPGLLLSAMFCIMILLLAKFKPSFVGSTSEKVELEPETLLSSAQRLLPIVVLVTVVLGGIYLGWFTPTQAGAVGAFATMVVTFMRRRLSWANLWKVLRDTGEISAAVLILVIGASVLTKALAMSTLPSAILQFAVGSGFGFWGIVGIFILVVLVLGMFLDSTSTILIAVPIVAPIVATLGADIIGPHVLIWFGLITVIAVEVGLLTPPFGISVFIVKNVVGDLATLNDIFTGVLPYIAVLLILILMCLLAPSLVTGVL